MLILWPLVLFLPLRTSWPSSCHWECLGPWDLWVDLAWINLNTPIPPVNFSMSSHTEDWSQTEQEWTRMIKKIGWLGFSWFYNNDDCCNYKRICPGIKNMCNFKQTFMSGSIYKWFINELSLKYLACHWKIITYCHFNTLTWYFDKKDPSTYILDAQPWNWLLKWDYRFMD